MEESSVLILLRFVVLQIITILRYILYFFSISEVSQKKNSNLVKNIEKGAILRCQRSFWLQFWRYKISSSKPVWVNLITKGISDVKVSNKYQLDLQKRIKNLRKRYKLYSVYKPSKQKDKEWIQQTLLD